MEIGIVGVGVVGGAVRHGLGKLGHRVRVHDTALGTSMADVLETQVVYLCVPTPSAADGSCDTGVVRGVADELVKLGYKGVIAVKSTVEPGTTAALSKRHPGSRFAYVPEFLREHAAVTDFTDDHDLCIIGAESDEDYELIKASHGHIPKRFHRTGPTEAELCKYFNNVYNATLITFANGFYELCGRFDVNYSDVKDAIVHRRHIFDKYLDCNENLRGFGGVCLPKDTAAIAALCEKLGMDLRLFNTILEDNEKHGATVYDGMRHNTD